jgi:RimJ/RimL family protein N-acetyltransferase
MLRNVLEDDLRIFFEHQRDPEANALAAFPAREWDTFLAHWRNKVLGNHTAVTRTILVDDEVAGYVGSWERDGRCYVAYWIGREYWGRGVATSAVEEFLRAHERRRPVFAYVVLSNTRSIRVLEKCGFQRTGEPEMASDEVAEVLFLFAGANHLRESGSDHDPAAES